MHFLFIFPSSGVFGGIETLLARMTKWLITNGHQVTLLLKIGGDWTDILPREARCVILGQRFKKLYYYYHMVSLWESLNIHDPDTIKSFDLQSSWVACQLATLVGNNCKVMAGIYNTLLFKWYFSSKKVPLWGNTRLYLRNYLKHIPPDARLFVGMDQIEELQEIHQQEGMLWPIPIDTAQFEAASRKPKWGKIVSVGRLAPMKEYNLYMIDVIKELRDKGHDVTWSVYGTGEYERLMRERIHQYDLDQIISIEGMVTYKKFWRILEDAYIFVGMGTSILEAALFEVPNITAAAYDREGVTCGSVVNYPSGSICPGNSPRPSLKVIDEIERILCLNPADYQDEKKMLNQHMQEHIIEKSMKKFLELTQKASLFSSNKSIYLANYPLFLLRKAMKILSKDRKIDHPSF